MSRAQILTDALLRDRADRAVRTRKITSIRAKPEGADFDPFAHTRWRVVAGDNPGYLPSTRMRCGPVGWFIACRACAVEFESKGLAYCADCMALPAEARRREATMGGLPNHLAPVRTSVRPSYAESTPENAHKAQSESAPRIIGPRDWPFNVIGGRRLPQEGPNPLGQVRVRPWV
jgi:hypothetical protein